VIAIAEAISMVGIPLTSLRLFSVGTTADVVHRHPQLDGGGAFQWARAATDILIRGQSRGVDGLAQHFLTTDRYLRHDTSVPKGVLRMDRCDTDELIGLARSRSRELMPNFKAMFAGHHVLPYQPLHHAQGAMA
jgi:hypothetical protein